MSIYKRLAVVISICFGIVLSTFLLYTMSFGYIAMFIFIFATILCGGVAIGSLLYVLKSLRIFAIVFGLFLVGAPFILFFTSYLLQATPR